jgi:fumarylacetoacetate (FAA) hydrolase family protein
LQIEGLDGFSLSAQSSMSMMSRDPLDLVTHAMGPMHQYPDGAMLFLGTMFAPTQDRFEPGKGFTHAVGDIVTVSAAGLGRLVNRVNHCDKIVPWTFGAVALMKNLAERRLL